MSNSAGRREEVSLSLLVHLVAVVRDAGALDLLDDLKDQLSAPAGLAPENERSARWRWDMADLLDRVRDAEAELTEAAGDQERLSA